MLFYISPCIGCIHRYKSTDDIISEKGCYNINKREYYCWQCCCSINLTWISTIPATCWKSGTNPEKKHPVDPDVEWLLVKAGIGVAAVSSHCSALSCGVQVGHHATGRMWLSYWAAEKCMGPPGSSGVETMGELWLMPGHASHLLRKRGSACIWNKLPE